MESLIDGESEKIARMAIEKATTGDPAMLRLCMDRIMPPRRELPVEFRLPRIESAEDAAQACAEITEAIACGYLTPGEARKLLDVAQALMHTLKAGEITERLTRLEASVAQLVSGQAQTGATNGSGR